MVQRSPSIRVFSIDVSVTIINNCVEGEGFSVAAVFVVHVFLDDFVDRGFVEDALSVIDFVSTVH